MTNYNNGKWHGWNGESEKPATIHDMSLFEYIWHDENTDKTGKSERHAGRNENGVGPAWGNILKFRVTKEHKEPREFWLDTIDAHQRRVATLCCSLADFIDHPFAKSDLRHAAMHHDEAERILGDMPAPAKAMFPELAKAYAKAEAEVLAGMGFEWNLTTKETKMLQLCDKLDAYTWARKHGARGPEWGDARTAIMAMAEELSAFEWVVTEMGRQA